MVAPRQCQQATVKLQEKEPVETENVGSNNGERHGIPPPRAKWTVHEIHLPSGQDDENLVCQHPLIHVDHIPPPTQGDREGRQEGMLRAYKKG